jgi:hypothetical protein
MNTPIDSEALPLTNCSAFGRLAWEKARALESRRDRYAEELEYQKAAECDTAAKTLYSLLDEIRSLPNAAPTRPALPDGGGSPPET